MRKCSNLLSNILLLSLLSFSLYKCSHQQEKLQQTSKSRIAETNHEKVVEFLKQRAKKKKYNLDNQAVDLSTSLSWFPPIVISQQKLEVLYPFPKTTWEAGSYQYIVWHPIHIDDVNSDVQVTLWRKRGVLKNDILVSTHEILRPVTWHIAKWRVPCIFDRSQLLEHNASQCISILSFGFDKSIIDFNIAVQPGEYFIKVMKSSNSAWDSYIYGMSNPFTIVANKASIDAQLRHMTHSKKHWMAIKKKVTGLLQNTKQLISNSFRAIKNLIRTKKNSISNINNTAYQNILASFSTYRIPRAYCRRVICNRSKKIIYFTASPYTCLCETSPGRSLFEDLKSKIFIKTASLSFVILAMIFFVL